MGVCVSCCTRRLYYECRDPSAPQAMETLDSWRECCRRKADEEQRCGDELWNLQRPRQTAPSADGRPAPPRFMPPDKDDLKALKASWAPPAHNGLTCPPWELAREPRCS
mmetsp:Transcript_60844/g.145008  ORF Transcript_60844/g.145008 Transcript_60844/m.145008 type:complete len:109 (+) Transcript_60844:64-390(+)